MIDKYENSYKYIEEFFNIYPLHQLDKEHLANIKELISKVKHLENVQAAYKIDIETSKEIINELENENKKLKLKAAAWEAVENLIGVVEVQKRNPFMGNVWTENYLSLITHPYITKETAEIIKNSKEVLND